MVDLGVCLIDEKCLGVPQSHILRVCIYQRVPLFPLSNRQYSWTASNVGGLGMSVVAPFERRMQGRGKTILCNPLIPWTFDF